MEIRILLGKAGKTPILLAEEYIKSVQTLLVYLHWGGTPPPLTVLECISFLLLGFIRISKSCKVSSDERRERGWEVAFPHRMLPSGMSHGGWALSCRNPVGRTTRPAITQRFAHQAWSGLSYGIRG